MIGKRATAIAAMSVWVAACGGGGGDGDAAAPTATLSGGETAPAPAPAPAPPPGPVPLQPTLTLPGAGGFALVGVPKAVPVTRPAGTGEPAAPIAWTSSDPAVAAVAPVGDVGQVAPLATGRTTVTATSGTQTAALTLNVVPVPASLSAFEALFPYPAGSPGGLAVGSDVSQAYSDAQLAQLSGAWTLFSGLFGRTPGPYARIHYTWDRGLLDHAKAAYPQCAGSSVAQRAGRVQLACVDGPPDAPYRVWLVAPDRAPSGTVAPERATHLASLSQAFMERIKTVNLATWSWLYDGFAYAIRSGTVDAQGRYTQQALADPEASAFRSALAEGRLIPLAELATLQPGPAADRAVAQSAMLMHYAWHQDPASVKALFAAIDSGAIATSVQAMQALAQALGYATLEQLDVAVRSYGAAPHG